MSYYVKITVGTEAKYYWINERQFALLKALEELKYFTENVKIELIDVECLC